MANKTARTAEEIQWLKDLGGRLKQAAKDAGMDATAVKTAMGCSIQTVYNYWKGTREMSLRDISRYSDVTGRPIEYFFDPAGKHHAQVDDVMMRIIRLGMEGIDLGQAYQMVLKQDGGLSRRELETASAGSDLFRAELTRRAGRPLDQLTEEERNLLARQVLADAMRPAGK